MTRSWDAMIRSSLARGTLSRREPRLSSAVFAEQFIGPLDMIGVEWGVGLSKVVDVIVVPGILIASIDQGLEIERDVLICLTKRNV